MCENVTKCEPYMGHRSPGGIYHISQFLKCCYTPGLCEPHMCHSPTPPSWHHTLVSSDVLHRHFLHKHHRKVYKHSQIPFYQGILKLFFIFFITPVIIEVGNQRPVTNLDSFSTHVRLRPNRKPVGANHSETLAYFFGDKPGETTSSMP